MWPPYMNTFIIHVYICVVTQSLKYTGIKEFMITVLVIVFTSFVHVHANLQYGYHNTASFFSHILQIFLLASRKYFKVFKILDVKLSSKKLMQQIRYIKILIFAIHKGEFMQKQ